MKIVSFGDSITGPVPRMPYQSEYLKYADLLQLLIDGHCGLGSATVLNRGYAGDKTYADGDRPGAVARLQEDVLDEQPECVTILIGGNDAKDTAADRARTRANLTEIVTRVQAAGMRALLLQYHVLPNPAHPETAWTGLADNNDLIAEIAAECALPLLDMHGPMQQALATYPLAMLVDLTDGVHLRPVGEIIYARTIFAKLAALGWLAPEVSHVA